MGMLVVCTIRYGNTTHPRGRRRSTSAAKKINLTTQASSCTEEAKKGRPPADEEIILAAVLYRMREGCSWRALSIFAPYTTVYTRWRQWCDQGIWERAPRMLAKAAKGKLWAIDSTCVKVHKHGTGGAGGTACQEVGNTRGGPNTKVHTLVDGRGRPLRVILSAGNRHDIIAAPQLVEGQSGRTILADKAYDTDAFRSLLLDLDLGACIPPRSGRRDPADFHRGFYKKRHRVENFFQRIKEKRAIATRYEKLGSCYRGLVVLTAILIWF